MTTTDQVQKLEALLERVRKNRTAAPHHAGGASAEPITLDAMPAVAAPVTRTPPMPQVMAAPTPPSPPAVAAPAAPPELPLPPLTSAWQPEPGSAVQARPESMPPESLPAEEIGEEDLLEVTTIPPAALESVAPAFVDEPELIVSEPPLLEPPVLEHDSMEVSEITAVGMRVTSTLEETLAGAVELDGEPLDGEREVPIKTPPPESGPQEALPPTGLEAARTPDVDQLEADLMARPSMGPTAEQLGETIELEPPRGPELEIDVTVEEPPQSLEPAPAEELEVALPRPSLESGLYDVTSPPPGEYPAAAIADEPPSLQQLEPLATVAVELPAADSPARMGRPALGATDVANVALAGAASPKTFVELLDASLLA